jgi:hypothetical protein
VHFIKRRRSEMDNSSPGNQNDERGAFLAIEVIYLGGPTSIPCPNCRALLSTGRYIVADVYEGSIEPYMAENVHCCHKQIEGPLLFVTREKAEQFIFDIVENMSEKEIAIIEFESLELGDSTIQ